MKSLLKDKAVWRAGAIFALIAGALASVNRFVVLATAVGYTMAIIMTTGATTSVAAPFIRELFADVRASIDTTLGRRAE